MAAVVLHVLLAVATLWNRKSDTIERRRVALREVQQSVMRRIKFSPAWKCAFHRHRDPMTEFHLLLFQMPGEMERPLRQIVNEDRAARFKHADTFVKPTAAPAKIFAVLQIVFITAVPVILAEIEWRISENRVDRLVADRSE